MSTLKVSTKFAHISQNEKAIRNTGARPDVIKTVYGQNTSFQDGKRLIELFDYLASEFDVNMDCRSGRG